MDALVFGAGYRGRAWYENVASKDGGITIRAFIDNNPEVAGTHIYTIPIIHPQNIGAFEFDKIFISVLDHEHVQKILQQLSSMGIADEKIDVLGWFPEYDEYSDHRVSWLRDFARYAYMCGMAGNVAECGVNRGQYAFFINKYFSDKTLYLFDTFEGFAKRDIEFELSL